MLNTDVLEQLQEIVDKENVLTSREDRIAYSYDGTPVLSALPAAAVLPQSVRHIQAILKLANEKDFAVVPRGSGTGLSGGSIPGKDSVVLLMNHWNQILDIDRENLTALVQPGVITAQLAAAVEEIGLFYPPDPGSMNVCTLGGNVAENAGGLRGLKYGVTRDYVMGMEAVLATGEVVDLGGKNVKDVSGYNLKDLLIGSEGTIAIFTKLLLKLIPKPQAQKTMLAYFPDMRSAAQTVSDIIAAPVIPATLEFLDNTTIRCVEDFAKIGLPRDAGALLLIEVDGHAEQVREEADKIIPIAQKNGATEVKIAANEKEADALKTARRSAFAALARVKPTTILEDATVPRSQLAPMVEKIQSIAAKHNITMGVFGHAGDGNLHPTALTDERDAEEMARVEKAFDEIFQAALELGGTLTGEHGIGLAKKRFLEKWSSAGEKIMMRKLKETFDPNGVLNPGKIFDNQETTEER